MKGALARLFIPCNNNNNMYSSLEHSTVYYEVHNYTSYHHIHWCTCLPGTLDCADITVYMYNVGKGLHVRRLN